MDEVVNASCRHVSAGDTQNMAKGSQRCPTLAMHLAEFHWAMWYAKARDIFEGQFGCENQWYLFEVGASPILVNFSGDWDVH